MNVVTSHFMPLFLPKAHTSVHTRSPSLLVGAGGCQVQPAQPALARAAPHVLQRIHPSRQPDRWGEDQQRQWLGCRSKPPYVLQLSMPIDSLTEGERDSSGSVGVVRVKRFTFCTQLTA